MTIKNRIVIPVVAKIIFLFVAFIFISNMATNSISIFLNSSEMIKLMKELLIKDLKEIYNYSNNQYEIYDFSRVLEKSIENIEKRAIWGFTNKNSIAIGIKEDGNFLFQASSIKKADKFTDNKILASIKNKRKNNINEGFINFKFNNKRYFGVYKFNPNWNVYIIRGEELFEFYKPLMFDLLIICLITVFISIFCAIIGKLFIEYILRYIKIISNNITRMIENQKLEIIDLKDASYDDVTFMGAAFNSLSSSINNIMSIFLKFVNKDIAQKAYKEKIVKLEGTKKELSILFSDIRGFTFMTETLGIDIIKLLNIHYENVINDILKHEGVIGSIIGDALLAVFGSLDESDLNKSYQAIKAGYEIQDITEKLRSSMIETKNKIVKVKGELSSLEKKVFKAVLIEIGVGIDGGAVFYGTIGSSSRMTNTVIGDNVNSASRLEGLTKIYKVPVICSEYIKKDIEDNVPSHDILFVELDNVQIAGKSLSKKVYWPVFKDKIDTEFKKNIEDFSRGLSLYYEGRWTEAGKFFKKCNLPMADVFIERLKIQKPKDWNGIWVTKTK